MLETSVREGCSGKPVAARGLVNGRDPPQSGGRDVAERKVCGTTLPDARLRQKCCTLLASRGFFRAGPGILNAGAARFVRSEADFVQDFFQRDDKAEGLQYRPPASARQDSQECRQEQMGGPADDSPAEKRACTTTWRKLKSRKRPPYSEAMFFSLWRSLPSAV
jgi:hypothetical protein